MRRFFERRSLRPALAIVGLTTLVAPAHAEIKDFEFQLVKTELRIGTAVVEVRLIDKRTGQLVPNAVIFIQRIDMAPDQMPTMASRIVPMPSTQPGVYVFSTNLMMQGGWRLSLSAKVQGETGTLQNELILQAKP